MSEIQKQPTLALWFMAALIVILPIEGTAALRNLLLFASLIAFGMHLWKTKTIGQLAFPLKWVWAAYASVATVGLIWAVNVPYSLSEIRHEIVIAGLVFWLAYNLALRCGLEALEGSLLVGNVFLVISCFYLFWQRGWVLDGLNGTFQTGVGNYSTYLVMVLPVLAWIAWKKQSRGQIGFARAIGLLVLLNLFAVLITQNRQSLIALAAECLAAFLVLGMALKLRNWIFLIVVLCGLGGAVALQTTARGYEIPSSQIIEVGKSLQADGRLSRWRFAINQAMEHPWYGAGLGRNTFKHVNSGHEISSSVFFHAHNMLVNRLVQLGIPGVLIFLMLFSSLPWQMWGNRKRSEISKALAVVGAAIAVGVLVKNMSDDFFMRELGYLYWVLGGAILGVQHTGRRGSSGFERILIIRRDNIGDLLCTTPLMRTLRQRYPMARIDALVNSYNAPVLANNPDLNYVYAYTKAKHRADGETVLGVHWRRLKLMWQLRQTQYDIVILAGDGNLDRQMGLARWLNAGQVIGFAPDDGKPRNGLDIVVPKPDKGHEVERSFSLSAPLGITGEPLEMVLVPDAREVERARTEISQVQGSPTIAIHISARKIPQRWPIERFAELIHTIHANSGARFVLLWSPGDENNPLHPGDDRKAVALQALVQGLPVVAYPTHTLAELIAVLSMCDRMICSDGGAMHIGAALGLPIVAMFGNSDAERWRPWCESYCVLQKPSRDVADVTVMEVLASQEALHKQIAGR